jgi:hypothetical protein
MNARGMAKQLTLDDLESAAGIVYANMQTTPQYHISGVRVKPLSAFHMNFYSDPKY